MVLIAMPAAGLGSTVASEARPAAQPAAADTTLAPADFAAEIDHLLETPVPATPPVEPAPVAAEPEGDTATLESSVDLPASAASRTGLLVWGTAGSIACFALGLLAAAWWTSGSEAPQSTAMAANVQIEQPAPKPPDPNQEEQPANRLVVEPELVAANKPVVPSEATEPVEPAPAATPPPEAVQVAALPDLPPVAPPPGESDTPSTEVDNRAGLPPLDPLAMDSANLDLLLIPNGSEAVNAATPDESFEQPPAEPAGDPAAMGSPPSDMRFEPGSARRGPTFAEDYAQGELTARLAVELPAVRWQDTPFHQAAAELAQLSGVPITIDPDALWMAGVRADRPVSLDAQQTSILDLAGRLANTLRLEIRRTPSGLVVAKPATDQWRKVRYRVDDLLDSEAGGDDLAALLRQFVAPQSWDDKQAAIDVAGDSLEIHQQTAIHYEILVFCERLRKARGLETRSKYPADLLSVEPRLEALSKPLTRSTTFAFVDWTPLVEVFDYWQQASGLIVLVDWQYLADHDLRPMATLAASVNNATWDDALDTCLAPLDLAWVPVDDRTLQITTRDIAQQTNWVEFYPGSDAAKLAEQIESRSDAASLANFKLAGDASGKFIIVRGNRQIHTAAKQ